MIVISKVNINYINMRDKPRTVIWFIENVYHVGNICIYTFVQFKGLNNIEPNHVSSQAMLGKLFWSWNVSSLKALCFIGINIHVILADSLISFVKIAWICTICQSLIFTANHLYNFNEWLGLEFFVSYWLVECPPLLFLCLLLIWVSIHCVQYNFHSYYQRTFDQWMTCIIALQPAETFSPRACIGQTGIISWRKFW